MVLEGNSGTTNAVFTITLAPTSTLPITVHYQTQDGTAIAGSDYVSQTGTLTFNPGETTKTLPIAVSGDTADESNETFTLNLDTPINADLIDAQGVGTIVDDDALPSLTISDVTVNEGNSGAHTAVFTVTLSPAYSQPITVSFATLAGTAKAGTDFQPVSGTLHFAPNETTHAIDVIVNGDVVDEGNSETFSVVLSNPINANLSDDIGLGTIVDDDTATIALGVSQSILEGDAGSTSITFTVSLSTLTAFTVTVDYATQSGVGGAFATPGIDYAATSGTLTFQPGDMTKTFTVLIYGELRLGVVGILQCAVVQRRRGAHHRLEQQWLHS